MQWRLVTASPFFAKQFIEANGFGWLASSELLSPQAPSGRAPCAPVLFSLLGVLLQGA